ncbi:hypothetical protein [Bdellovibrio sp. HCB337]|uniref:hypothetical protein n=1 Tax=Bdellovibrio sp. HCB337 TaxID=3394358 RepID=UPI0039A6B5A7
MKHLILISTLLTLTTTAFAKNLDCFDAPSYTGRSFFMNRDGGIGYNGTYIVLKTESLWDLGSSPIGLDQITGRPTDSKFVVKGFTLAISPKSACTNPNAPLLTPFKCSAQQATVIATGETTQKSTGGDGTPINDRITVSSQLKAEVEVELVKTPKSARHEMVLQGTIKAVGEKVHFAVPVTDIKEHCEITGS